MKLGAQYFVLVNAGQDAQLHADELDHGCKVDLRQRHCRPNTRLGHSFLCPFHSHPPSLALSLRAFILHPHCISGPCLPPVIVKSALGCRLDTCFQVRTPAKMFLVSFWCRFQTDLRFNDPAVTSRDVMVDRVRGFQPDSTLSIVTFHGAALGNGAARLLHPKSNTHKGQRSSRLVGQLLVKGGCD